MKLTRTNKKGFTIVELVIVIAVIAILAAVLIPNLSRLVGKANESKAMQEARNILAGKVIDYGKDVPSEIDMVIKVDDYYFAVDNGQLDTTAYKTFNEAKAKVTPATGYQWDATDVTDGIATTVPDTTQTTTGE